MSNAKNIRNKKNDTEYEIMNSKKRGGNYIRVLMCSAVSDSATPRNVAGQAPPSMEFSRQEYWSGLPFPSPGDLSDPGIEPVTLSSPALADSLPPHHLGSHTYICRCPTNNTSTIQINRLENKRLKMFTLCCAHKHYDQTEPLREERVNGSMEEWHVDS